MNSSAITNNILPTVSVPGATSSESKGSGFGDIMASITDNWSEHSQQVKYDAAKSAQSAREEDRANLEAERAAQSKHQPDDRPDEIAHDDFDDHARHDDEPRADDPQNVEARHSDDDPAAHEDTQHAENNGGKRDADASSEDNAQDTPSSDDDTANSDGSSDDTLAADGMVDPNQPAQSIPLAGSPEALELAKAQPAGAQVAGAAAVNTAATANGQGNVNPLNGAAAADATTDGLMSSTALSQPAAASSAKMALNGAEADTGDTLTSDKFLSRVVDSMTGDTKAKSDVNAATNTTINGQAANTNQQANATNPAQTAQAAQQAMAAAAGAQNLQNTATAPQNIAANGAVTATGGSEATAQGANGQINSTNNLLQTNTGGQTAQTARQAPAQQVQQQVAVSIRNAASEGVDKISVQLRPEHLGRVDVKMEIGQDGRIQGVIQADTRETLDMLRQDSRSLQQALKDAGLNADSQSFTFEHRNEGGQGQDGNGQSRATADQGSSPDDGDVLSGTELAEHVAIGYGINPNGLVDIRI